MERLNSLLEQFEVLYIQGTDTDDVGTQIYKELIELGILPDEITDKHKIADILLIDIKYEFCCEEALEALIQDLKITAKVDFALHVNYINEDKEN